MEHISRSQALAEAAAVARANVVAGANTSVARDNGADASLPAKHRSAMLGMATHPFARMVLGELPASRDACEFNERI